MGIFRKFALASVFLFSNYVVFEVATKYAEEIAQAKEAAVKVKDAATPVADWTVDKVTGHPIIMTILAAIAGLFYFGKWMTKDPEGAIPFDVTGTISKVVANQLETGKGLYVVTYNWGGKDYHGMSAYGPPNLAAGTTVLLETPMIATANIVRAC